MLVLPQLGHLLLHGFQFQLTKQLLLLCCFGQTTQILCSETESYTKRGFSNAIRPNRSKRDVLSVGRGQSKPLKFKTETRAVETQTENWQRPLGRKSKQWPGSLWLRTKWLSLSGGRPLGARSTRSGNLGSLPRLLGLSQNIYHRGLLLK